MICSSGLSLGFPLRLAIVGSPKPAHKLSLKRRPFPLVIWGGGGVVWGVGGCDRGEGGERWQLAREPAIDDPDQHTGGAQWHE